MTATLRQTANTVANSMIEGASMASALIGATAGAYLGYQLAPAAWSDGTRVLFAGAVAVIGARRHGRARRTRPRPDAPADADPQPAALHPPVGPGPGRHAG